MFRVLREWRLAVGRDRAARRNRRRLSTHEIDFLPAHLEIMERPVSPGARLLALTLCLLFAAALAWSVFGRVDIVAVAPGRIIPDGRVKTVQPAEGGIVTAIHVREGDTVAAGKALLALDDAETRADRDRLHRDLMATRIDIARLAALAAGGDDPAAAFAPPEGADPRLVAAARAFVEQRWAQYRATIAGILSEIERRKAQIAAARAGIARLEAAIPLLAQRVEARERLAQRETGTLSSFLELKQQLVQLEGELAVARAQLRELEEGLVSLDHRRREAIATFTASVQDDLARALRQAGSLEQDLAKAESRLRQKIVYAPIAGIVQQLQVTTVGAVVKSGDVLMVIVPENSVLEIEAMVSNKDIGFVRVGQEADIKLDSFPFTTHGLIRGRVLALSADAVQDKDRNLVFAARIALERSYMTVGGKRVSLGPGMTAAVEIKTGERRLIQYVLSPLIRYAEESLRER